MRKNIMKVGGILMALALVFIIWQVVFNDGGILQTAYNGGVNVVNEQWKKVSGSTDGILPTFGDTGAKGNQKVLEFDIK